MAAAGRTKILLIDDDKFFLKVLADTFSEAGFTVVTAADGILGVKAYVEELPDAVISDLIMPRMGGVSTCLEIARLAGQRDPVIVLLTSMFQGAPHEHQEPEMGAKVHIPKSTSPLDIVIIVEQLLERKRRASAA
ncbi:MAG TPA: response regulator [Geomonas sp.]|nr:response regulator [Geomonas sp.]